MATHCEHSNFQTSCHAKMPLTLFIWRHFQSNSSRRKGTSSHIRTKFLLRAGAHIRFSFFFSKQKKSVIENVTKCSVIYFIEHNNIIE